MSNEKFDPLANLFNMAQLSGLSGIDKKAKEENPLGINFDKLDSSAKKTRPKTPPKPRDDIPQEDLLEIDEEESSSSEDENPPSLEEAPKAEEPIVQKEEEPEEDPEIALRLALAQQALMRAKIKRQREAEEAKKEAKEKARKEQEKKSAVAERLANISGGHQKSAMDLFMDALEEPEKKEAPKAKAKPRPKPQPKAKPKPKAKPVKKSTSVAKETTNRPMMANTLSLSITALIQNHLPSLAEFHVASAMDSFNRPQLKAMWMTKRTQFLQSGKLEYAVAAVSVLDALETVSQGQLVAAYVETTASDYLIWVDREHNRLVAAFANAGEYFG